jgi:hypothetical protein
MLKYNGGVLVSTFEGEGNGNDFWAAIKTSLANEGIKITFAPAFISFRDPNQTGTLVSSFPSIDGFFNWWSWCVEYLHRLNSCSVEGMYTGQTTWTPPLPRPPILPIEMPLIVGAVPTSCVGLLQLWGVF